MPHHTPLISTIVIGLVLALVLGVLAHRMRLSPLIGYLLAGVAVGPFTPGYVANQSLANELAEIGVILLMFGVGLHFSLKDLLSVRAIAIPGAIVQIASATALGMGLAHLMGWTIGGGLVFGLALSVASTVVLLRALQERRLIETERGRIAVGWLIVEDLAMVLTLVLLPAAAGLLTASAGSDVKSIVVSLLLMVGKVAAFVAVMLVVGRRIIPWFLHFVAHTGSRELFRLSVLAIALGVAFGAATLFGVSFALGAFFAGMILSESELSQRAASETLPLRDAFAVLFFVSVGMLFNPMILVEDPGPVLATLFIIVIGKSLAAFAIVLLFGHPKKTALTIAVSLAQIGEFSFILAGLGVSLGLLPEGGRDLILAGAILSILINPFLFTATERLLRARETGSDRRGCDAGSARAGTDAAHHADGSRRARRLWEGGSVRPRGSGERLGALRHRRDEFREGRRPQARGGRGDRRQCRRPGGCRCGEPRQGALPPRRHSGFFRERPGRCPGAHDQPVGPDHRAGAFGCRDRAPFEVWRDEGRPRRAGDRSRDGLGDSRVANVIPEPGAHDRFG